MVVGTVVSFVVALLVGGLGIHLGAAAVGKAEDYEHAIVTALLGALAWVLTGWIPLFGPIIALIAWIGVINWRYRGGWVDAAIIGFLAWLAATVVLWIVNSIFRLGIGAFGIPGV
ncbi:MAG: hypothetical protein ACOCY6_03125 [Halodesulfurarchaeum sp.]